MGELVDLLVEKGMSSGNTLAQDQEATAETVRAYLDAHQGRLLSNKELRQAFRELQTQGRIEFQVYTHQDSCLLPRKNPWIQGSEHYSHVRLEDAINSFLKRKYGEDSEVAISYVGEDGELNRALNNSGKVYLFYKDDGRDVDSYIAARISKKPIRVVHTFMVDGSWSADKSA